MNGTLWLLTPKLQGARNGFRRYGKERARALFLGTLALLFWAGTFAATYAVLRYLEGTPEVGPQLAKKTLSLIVVMCLSVLLYSNVIVAVSVYFLSHELDLVFATPVRSESVFYSKFIETLALSSWMILLFLAPVLLAFGAVRGAGAAYYLGAPVLLLCFCAIPAALAVMLGLTLANVFPARKLRDLLFLLLILALSGIIFFVRYLRPELLVNPEVRESVMDYMLGLERVGSPWLPSTWLTETLSYLLGIGRLSRDGALLYTFLLVTSAGAFLVLTETAASRLHFAGWSRTQEARRIELDRPAAGSLKGRFAARFEELRLLRIFSRAARRGLESFCRLSARLLSALVPGVRRPIVEKDLLVFFRDVGQWSQLLLVGAITAIYILNVYVIRLARGIDLFWMKTVISFLNIGMVGFVLASVCLRFAYPAVSLEGEAFWILRSSPVRAREILRSKLWTYLPPLLGLGLVLAAASNWLLDVHPFIAWMGVGTVALFVFGVGSMAVGLGAQYPDFRYENAARISMSYGGVLYMLLAMSYVGAVVLIEAGPVYLYLMAEYKGLAIGRGEKLLIGAALGAVAVLTALAVWIPLQRGRAALEEAG